MSRRDSLVRGAFALALAGLMIKLSNLLVRLPLTRLMGTEGLGIYQMALPAFHALLHLAAGGVPVAVQNLVAEQTALGRKGAAEWVMRIALLYALVAGGLASLLLLLGAPWLARLLGEPRAFLPLVAVAPAVLLSAVDAIYRHYLQGRKQITPNAVASVLEQGSKVAVTLVAAYLLMPLGRHYAAAGAALGITGGAVASLGYMLFVVWRIRREEGLRLLPEQRPAGFGRRMLRLAWPITLGSITLPLLNLLDVPIIQRGFMKAGYLPGEATALYGAYAGIAVQVVWFPFVLTNALANAMVPVLTAAQARGDLASVREKVMLGLRATSLICLPITIGAMIFAGPIARLFGEPQAAEPLRYLGPMALLGPLTWLMVAQLQALGETAEPMRNMVLAMVVKMALDALLSPIRGVDVKGVAVASVVMFLLCVWLNGRALERVLDEPLPWQRLLRGPLLASLVMGAVLVGLTLQGWIRLDRSASLLVAVVVAPLLYAATLVATRTLTRTELLGMSGPLAPRLERLLQIIWPWS